MELFSMEWLLALTSIIIVDLLLAGDNAIVIALAARNLPKELQRKAVIYGTFGAIFIRVVLTFFVTYLLKIQGLGLVGGVLLYFIAWRLLNDNGEEHYNKKIAPGFFRAIVTIVVADTVMGLDNVLAIAGAARGDFLLILIGLGLSIPIMMWGSFFILKMLKRMPWLTLFGSALLSGIAGRIIFDDKWVKSHIDWSAQFEWFLIIVVACILTIIAWGSNYFLNKKKLQDIKKND